MNLRERDDLEPTVNDFLIHKHELICTQQRLGKL